MQILTKLMVGVALTVCLGFVVVEAANAQSYLRYAYASAYNGGYGYSYDRAGAPSFGGM